MTEEEYKEKINTMDKCVEYWKKKAEKLEKVNKEFNEQLIAFDKERTEAKKILSKLLNCVDCVEHAERRF